MNWLQSYWFCYYAYILSIHCVCVFLTYMTLLTCVQFIVFCSNSLSFAFEASDFSVYIVMVVGVLCPAHSSYIYNFCWMHVLQVLVITWPRGRWLIYHTRAQREKFLLENVLGFKRLENLGMARPTFKLIHHVNSGKGILSFSITKDITCTITCHCHKNTHAVLC